MCNEYGDYLLPSKVITLTNQSRVLMDEKSDKLDFTFYAGIKLPICVFHCRSQENNCYPKGQQLSV